MLKLEITIHDQLWPMVVITAQRESYANGRLVFQEKVQYDLAYGKAENMVHNQLKPMVEELINRRKQR